METFDTSKLPAEVRERLAQLELELSEGDITQKGFEKKRSLILAPYVAIHTASSSRGQPSPSTRAHRRAGRKVTRDENRYHSEVRAEAVAAAIAAYSKDGKQRQQVPVPPVKRSSSRSQNRQHRGATTKQATLSDSTSDDDDSLMNETSIGGGRSALPPAVVPASRVQEKGVLDGVVAISRAHQHSSPSPSRARLNSSEQPPAPARAVAPLPDVASSNLPPSTPPTVTPVSTPSKQQAQQRDRHRRRREENRPTSQPQKTPAAPIDKASSAAQLVTNGAVNGDGAKELHVSASSPDVPKQLVTAQANHRNSATTALLDLIDGGDALRQPREQQVYENTAQCQQPALASPVPQQGDYANAVLKPAKVSTKIQQLLNTLQRPKKKPLQDYYNDDDAELEAMAKTVDPNAPKPEGAVISPARGDQVRLPSTIPSSMDAALQRFGSACHKSPAATVLDQNAKPSQTLTYGKLLSRAYKVAYALLNKIAAKPVTADGVGLKAGDRVAVVYPNNDPLSFMVGFHGCMLAGVVPVPLEVPLSKRDAGIQQLGFLLGSCSVRFALTSEACYKGLPKSLSGEIADFKGWPKLTWYVTEHLQKPPKDWLPPPRLTDESVAYIEYTSSNDGSVKGVSVTRASVLAHCRALTHACEYQEGEIIVCVLDFKREVGLWHSILTSVYNGMHVIFVPYSLMKINPASWMQMVTKFRAAVAIVKSRDLHWGLLATRDHKDINLSSLRLLLVADGANPWSLSSCDQFLQVFQSRGLKAESLCPCSGSTETGTVSIRRPGRTGFGATGRGILSMSALTFGVVRVDQENSLTSLTLQDAGQVLPGATAVVVKLNGAPNLCKADEIGEICLYAHSAGSSYWGLNSARSLTTSTFKVEPLVDSRPLGAVSYVRSGLIGFLGPGGLVFVCGTRQGLMQVSGRAHSSDDLIATVLAVEPMKFIYRGRIAVFSVTVLRDERIVIVAEQKPDVTEEESFQWMSRVLQAIDSIHQVGIYCLALVQPNQLPKTSLGGIHAAETRQKFIAGELHPTNLLMCPHTCVTNLPKPRERTVVDVGPAAVFCGAIVQGTRISAAAGRELGSLDEEKFLYLADVLRWRATQSAEHELFTLINSKGAEVERVSCAQLHRRAERIGCLLLEKGRLNPGDHVALVYPPGIDLICAFYGCLYVGMVPICVRPPHPQNLQTTLPTIRMIVDVSKAVAILSTSAIIKLLRSKEASNRVDVKAWPTVLDTDELPRKKLTSFYRPQSAEDVAYLDFSVSTTGMLAGIKMSFAALISACKSLKLACELYPSRHVCLCLDPYCGLGFQLWTLCSVYCGHHTLLIPPSEVEQNPTLWLSVVSNYKVRDTFCSYGVMELCVRELGSQLPALKERQISLGCLRTCVAVAEERPRVQLCTAFARLFAPLGLLQRAVSTSFGCRVNIAICMQGASSPDPTTVYVDTRALRNDRVTLVEKGAPHSLALMESGKLLPGVKVVIANPDTKGQLADSHLGEIWVQSPHNASGYFTVYGEETSLHDDHFNARLSTGDTRTQFARTGYLGFLRQTQLTQADGGLHDAVFVVGGLDETLMLRGARYHPVDIEASVLRAHKKICECAVFTWTNLLVIVVELEGPEGEALDLVPLVTSAVLEDHHLIVGVVVIVDPATVPINSRGEKQRMHLRDAFLHDQLDPIYVAYNM